MNQDRRAEIIETLAVLSGIIEADKAEAKVLAAGGSEDEGQDIRDEYYTKAYKEAHGGFNRGWDADMHSGTTPENLINWVRNEIC